MAGRSHPPRQVKDFEWSISSMASWVDLLKYSVLLSHILYRVIAHVGNNFDRPLLDIGLLAAAKGTAAC